MRVSDLLLGLTMGGLAAGVAVAACNGLTEGGGGSGASGGGSVASSDVGASGGGDVGSASASTSSGIIDPCSPKDGCPAADTDCIGLVDNGGTTASLRMAQLDLSKPDAFAKGLVKNVVAGAVTPVLPACNLGGSGTFSWLLRFDLAAGTIETGGAKPVLDPTQGYAFVDEIVDGLLVAPVTLDAPVADGSFAVMTGGDVVLPIYLDANASQVLLLPIHSLRFTSGTLSQSKNCIGTYNAANLDPANGCDGDDVTPKFLDAAKLDGFMTLEEADGVVIASLAESLCVLLSDDPATYGDGGSPVNKCKRTNGTIDYHGDWCAGTDAPADASCFDAMTVRGDFAASSVLITN